MGLDKIAQDSKKMTNYRLDQKIDKLLRTNPSFKNLQDNKKLVFDLISDYKKKMRRGISVSSLTIRKDMYHLYKNRIELGLSKSDLDDLRDLLASFKS